MDTKQFLIERLRALCKKEGGHVAVAERAGVNDQTIYQIVAGIRLPSGEARGIGPRVANKLDAAFPGWSALPQTGGAEDTTASVVDRKLSLSGDEYLPLVEWEVLMRGGHAPEMFRATLVDDAMAPRAPAGTVIRFQVMPPVVGDAVIVRDSDGALHFRQYRQRPGGGFLAHPTNPAYSALDSVEHGLAVIAVMVSIDARGHQVFG